MVVQRLAFAVLAKVSILLPKLGINYVFLNPSYLGLKLKGQEGVKV